MRKYLILLSICLLLVLCFSFCYAQIKEKTFKKTGERAEETSKSAKDFLVFLFENFPRAAKQVWEKLVSSWKNIFDRSREAWEEIVWENIRKVSSFIIRQIKERFLNIREEFEKEKEEF